MLQNYKAGTVIDYALPLDCLQRKLLNQFCQAPNRLHHITPDRLTHIDMHLNWLPFPQVVHTLRQRARREGGVFQEN